MHLVDGVCVCVRDAQLFFFFVSVDVKPAVTAVDEVAAKQQEAAQQQPAPRDLSDEQKQTILVSGEFQRFFDQATRVVERALTEADVDLFVDYTGASDTESKL